MDQSEYNLENWLQPDYPNNEKYYHRKFLPTPMNNKNDSPNIFNLMMTNSGKDLSKITMPINLNEPISFLQRISEYMEYSNLLFQACLENDPIIRLEILTAFIIASVSSSYRRSGKPFNPLLGETFELNKKEERGYIFVSEQVSHHPPISAFYVDAEPYFRFWGSLQPKLKFWGKSLEIYPKGTLFLHLLEFNEVYQWQNVPSVINNLLIGKVNICHQGESTLKCFTTKTKAHIKWKSSSWFKNNEDNGHNQVEAQLYNSNLDKVKIIYGKWNESLFSVTLDEWDQTNGQKYSQAPLSDSMVSGVVSKIGNFKLFNNSSFQISPHSSSEVQDASVSDSLTRHFTYSPSEDRKTLTRSTSSCNPSPTNSVEYDLHFPLQTCLWKVSQRPAHSRLYYNFTFFTLTLNEIPRSNYHLLPPTDSRKRPDIRLFEQGKIEEASQEKQRLEEKQRINRKKMKTKKSYQELKTLWFKLQYCEYTDCEEWSFNGNYFNRKWDECSDIF